ncbi:MAG: hypothetical protein AB1644_08730 [Candidatus Zixiibacteriota bacterium]
MTSTGDKYASYQLSKAEMKAIEVHKYYLSRQAGYDVGLEYTIAHWLAHHASRWRKDRLTKELQEQMKEIERHKWIESEKAGRDLGDQAVFDWVRRFAAQWRHWKDQQEVTD